MGEQRDRDHARRPRLACTNCHGRGHIDTPKLAILDDIPQTVLAFQTCRWCKGSGWRKSFSPPA